jgi:hypothetical protein
MPWLGEVYKMNFRVGIVDENGNIQKITINEKFLVELNQKLKSNGITAVHTSDGEGRLRTYNAQAIIIMARDCKGSIMFIPNDSEITTKS